MSVDSNDIDKLSNLAKITISQSDIDRVTGSINEVLELVDQLQAQDTAQVAPMSHPLDAVQRLRIDEVTETNQRELLQKNAPESERGLFLVPKVID